MGKIFDKTVGIQRFSTNFWASPAVSQLRPKSLITAVLKCYTHVNKLVYSTYMNQFLVPIPIQ